MTDEKRKGISTASCKQKARKLQQLVARRILQAFPDLTEDDVLSNPMGSGGEDVLMSRASRDKFPFSVECKAHSKIAVYKFYEQAARNTPNSQIEPLVVIKADRKKPLVLIDLEAFMSLWDE